MARKQVSSIQRKKQYHTVNKRKIINIAAVFVLAAFAVYLIFSTTFQNEQGKNEHMFNKEGELTLTDSSGNAKIKIDIEIADNEYDRQLGLMFRRDMEQTQGMLFIFPVEEMQSFWMRNTYIPLDIMFINSNKEIITIHKTTVPLSDQSYPSTDPSIYVLEVNAGFTDRYKIVEGDKVEF